jgi:hypothetical protein
MTGAPSITDANGQMNVLLLACLVNGFNTQAPTGATASGGVITLTYATAPGFEVGATITLSGATNTAYNGDFRVLTTGTTVTVSHATAPNGTVAGTLSTKYAGMGWTRPYSGTNLGAYRQGGSASHKRFIRVYDGTMNSTQRINARGYETMTSISAGTGPFPTTAEVAGNGPESLSMYTAGGGAGPWFCVGTPRSFYIMYAYDNAGGDVNPVAHTGSWGLFGFTELVDTTPGDIYAYNIPADYNWPSGAGWGSRSYTGVSGSRTRPFVGFAPGSSLGSGQIYPDPNFTGFMISPKVYAYQQDQTTGAYAFRGFMPGFVGNHHTLLAGGTAHYESEIFANLPGITGRAILMNWYQGGPGFLLKLDEDWGDV